MFSEASDKQSWYHNWFNAPYYHLLYADRDEQEAAAFIDLLLQRLQPPAQSTMLDVACGRGRHCIHLAEHPYQVTGIDLSEESIEEARKHEHEGLSFFVHDMRLPFRSNYFNYIFNFFTSFGYFDTWAEHENTIGSIAEALRSNGIFIMDYLNVHYVEKTLESKTEVERDGVRFRVERWFDPNHFYKKIIVEDPANLKQPLTFEEKVTKFTLYDFKAMFTAHGLQIEEVYGDYSFGKYDTQHSPRLIMKARKTKS